MALPKSDQEVEKMREAGRVVAQLLAHLGQMVIPGIRTIALDQEAERFIQVRGAVATFKGYRGYPASICVSINEEVVHGIPSRKQIREGDIVSIDAGATLNGYIADAAVTVPAGKVSDDRAALVAVTRRALHAGIDQACLGNRLGDVSHAVYSHASRHGYGVVREYCGHGVGRDLHEPPQVSNFGVAGTGPRLGLGWTLAIEPMINMGSHEVRVLADGWTVVTSDGKPSAHFEHTVAITAAGPVILTLP